MTTTAAGVHQEGREVAALNCLAFDAEQAVVVPPRSDLYPLVAIGIGTVGAEKQTSYLPRLAVAHCVTTHTLVKMEIIPRFGRKYFLDPKSLGSFWTADTSALNGTQSWAASWVQQLEVLTLRTDLRYTTMLPWASVVPSRGLLRRTRAWCPLCFEEWHAAGRVIYEPLLWALQAVTQCPWHGRSLQVLCPHPGCQQSLLVLDPVARPGYCSHCAGWLGVKSDNDSIDVDEPGEDRGDWDSWVADAAGAIIAAAPHMKAPPSPERISEALSFYRTRLANGNGRALARMLSLPPMVLHHYLSGRYLPEFETLLHICYGLGVSPLKFLTDRTIPEPDVPTSQLPLRERPLSRPRRQFDREQVRRELEAHLHASPPQSMSAVARQLGYDHGWLLQQLPDASKAIAARYRAYRAEQHDARVRRICREVRQAVFQIHDRGEYPSADRIRAHLGTSGHMRLREGIEARHQAMRELGIT